MLNIDELRDPEIELHGLDKADWAYTFYHDETNNIRKLHIGADGLNVADLKVFVLGGIVHEGPPRPIDIGPLRNAMRIQMTAKEIKLEHVAKGHFLEVLQSNKLTTFLRWLSQSGLMIHYHDLDPLYWSIVDIIDSIIPQLRNPVLIQYHALLKADLAAVLKDDLPATIALFHRYGYPGLSPKDRKPFLETLIERVENHRAGLPSTNTMMLKGVLQAGLKLDSLDFIEGFPANLLIEDFSAFYLNRLAVFKHSTHVLDMEDTIREQMLRTPLTSGGAPVTHYRFADSKAEPGIQISDVTVGLLGKMHSFLREATRDEVIDARTALKGAALENAELLCDLISASHEANIAFLNHVASGHDIDKLDLFLRFKDGAYAT